MKRLVWILALLLAASPAMAAKKITVQQLRDLLVSLHQAQKTDAEVAAELEEVELTEELTRAAMNSMGPNVPGQLSTEQMFVLEARSAVLAPPASELPVAPGPDAATQKAILDKAVDYATKTYAQLPNLTATKATRRFQDSMDIPKDSLGSHSSVAPPALISPIRYTAGGDTTVTLRGGVEQNPLEQDKTHWGANTMIALLGQSPVPITVIQEAQAAGKIEWQRWEIADGKQAAVYSFSVDKKKSHYAVNYCCFPDSNQAGQMSLRGGGSESAGPGNYATNTSWKNFKATVPYHGEIFVDPDTGIVVRLITVAEFKSSDWVREENQRIDYGPETVGGKTLVLPVRSTIDTLALPYGDDGRGRFILRRTLFTSEYKNYQGAN